MTRTAIQSLVIFAASLLFSLNAFGQKNDKQTAGPLMTRTTTRHENYRLSYGGTVTLVGAPAGSITIEGWEKNEVDVTASIELQAPNATALDQLAMVNTFAVDVDLNHIRIMTTGTHDRVFMKRIAKNLPKALIGLPWKLDYVIKIPALTDLEVDAGNGPIRLKGVEGALRLNAVQSDAVLSLTGGEAHIIVQKGSIVFHLNSRNWHGLGAEVKLASGELNVILPTDASADLNAEVVGAGDIEIKTIKIDPSDKVGLTARAVHGRTGNGGATLSFIIGNGKIRIGPAIGSGRSN